MNKTVLISIFILCISTFGFSQSDYITLNSNAFVYYRSGDFEKSAIYWDSIYTYTPTFFDYSFPVIVHYALKNDKNAVLFLKYYGNTHLYSAKVVHSINAYIEVKNASRKEKIALKKSIISTINSESDTTIYSGLFYTAVFDELLNTNSLGSEEIHDWIKALEAKNNNASVYNFLPGNSYKKYLHIYLVNKAFEFGYGPIDSIFTSNASPEDPVYFDKDIKRYGFRGFKSVEDIQKPLIDQNFSSNPSAFLDYASNLVVMYPTLKNLKWLEEKWNSDEIFSLYWITYCQKNWEVFQTDSIVNNYIKLNTKPNQYVILDIWGTWCTPCVQEMPRWAKMDTLQKSQPNPGIKFLTLSFHSANLNDFMNSNNYNFPVLEVEKSTMKMMEINSYPTSVLISPAGKMVVLPFWSDKEEIVKTYTLLDW